MSIKDAFHERKDWLEAQAKKLNEKLEPMTLKEKLTIFEKFEEASIDEMLYELCANEDYDVDEDWNAMKKILE